MAISHRLLLHFAAVCIFSLVLQFLYNDYRSSIIFVLPLLHLASVCMPSLGFQIFYSYHRHRAVTIVTTIRNRLWLYMLLIIPTVCWILSEGFQTLYYHYQIYIRLFSSVRSLDTFCPVPRSINKHGRSCAGPPSESIELFSGSESHLKINYLTGSIPIYSDELKPTAHVALSVPPPLLSRGEVALLVVALLLAVTAALILLYLSIRYLVRKSGRNQAYPRLANGDMERSLPRDTQTITGDASPNAAPHFGQLSCTKHGHQEAADLMVGRPAGMTKMRVFDYGMLASATGGFKSSSVLQQIVRGIPSRTMYRGMLISDEGLQTAVVIKRFDIISEEMCKHVQEDVKGQLVLQHRNLLCPLGYCLENGAFYVVYEYMVNGSLDQHLFQKESSPHQRPCWAQRCRIIKGVAAGLQYLHRNISIHGSVKTSNILLDQDMTPRLGDFGFSAAAFNPSFAPDLSTGCAADIFSFSTVIADVLCGERWNKEHRERGIPAFSFLVERAWDLAGNGGILGAIDADLAATSDFDEGKAETMLQVGLACSHPDPRQRPSMEDVVDFLTGKVPLPEVALEKKDC